MHQNPTLDVMMNQLFEYRVVLCLRFDPK